MPTFNAYPASQVRAPDVWGAMQRGAEGAQMNQLRQMQMEGMQADRQAQAQSQQQDRALEQVSQIADLLTPFADPRMPPIQKAQMWPQMLQRAQAMGLPIDKAPPQYDPQFVAMTMAQAGKYQAMAKEGADTLSQEAEEQKIRIAQASRAPEKPLALERKLRLAGIDPNSEEGKKLILADLAGQQINIKEGEEGLEISIGKSAGAGMEKKTKATIEQKIMDNSDALTRMDRIRRKYKRQFLEWGPRIDATVLNWKSKAGFKLTKDQSAFVKEIASFNRDAIENINLYIKAITGAQMSEKEADRIRLAQPDPGEGVFGGDSPEQFEAKFESAYEATLQAQARYTYWLHQGVDIEEMSEPQREVFTSRHPLSGIMDIMKSREKKIITEVRQTTPDIEDDELRDILKKRISAEFGIGG